MKIAKRILLFVTVNMLIIATVSTVTALLGALLAATALVLGGDPAGAETKTVRLAKQFGNPRMHRHEAVVLILCRLA